MLAALRKQTGSILFIDEIHTVVGAGATSGGSLDASNILKPALASGELRCIGSTTYHDYKSYFERDRALARRFQKIEVREPTAEETHEILKGLKSHYESITASRYTRDALRAAAELSAKHINDRHLPDKAIDVIDEAGAIVQMLPPSQSRKIVRTKDIEHVVATMAKIPPRSVSVSDRERLETLERDLKLSVFGQDEAIEHARVGDQAVARRPRPSGEAGRLVPVRRADGRRQDRGRASSSRRSSASTFLRFDMSEYMETHTVSRLIGAPPGYVGFDQGGLLTDAIRKTPHAVLLLDEIEKAHPEPLQHPAAGDGPRHAHRQQRPQGRLPQRHPDHDDQRRGAGDGGGRDRLRRTLERATRAAEGDRAALQPRVPQPPRRDHLLRRRSRCRSSSASSTSSFSSSTRS